MLILVYPTKAQVSPKSENLFLLKCIFFLSLEKDAKLNNQVQSETY